MKIILLERVRNLGFMGDVVDVKAGYGRNYLLPQKKAMRANKANLEIFETKKVELEATNLHKKTEAEAVAKKIETTSVVIVQNAGESGQLYGSVTMRDIAEKLASESGITVHSKQVYLAKPIKTVGIHTFMLTLHPEVELEMDVNVARSEDEAEMQAKGIDVIAEKRAQLDRDTHATAGSFGAAAEEESDEVSKEDADTSTEDAAPAE